MVRNPVPLHPAGTSASQLLRRSLEGLPTPDDTALAALTAVMRPRLLRHEEFLSRPGQTRHVLGLVETGLLRLLYLDGEGRELTKAFFTPAQWFSSGLLPTEPALASLQALAETKVWLADAGAVQALLPEHHSLTLSFQALLARHMSLKQRREIELLTLSGKERYLRFQAALEPWQGDIPLAGVASYIGVTPTQLSRIRRQLGMNGGRT